MAVSSQTYIVSYDTSSFVANRWCSSDIFPVWKWFVQWRFVLHIATYYCSISWIQFVFVALHAKKIKCLQLLWLRYSCDLCEKSFRSSNRICMKNLVEKNLFILICFIPLRDWRCSKWLSTITKLNRNGTKSEKAIGNHREPNTKYTIAFVSIIQPSTIQTNSPVFQHPWDRYCYDPFNFFLSFVPLIFSLFFSFFAGNCENDEFCSNRNRSLHYGINKIHRYTNLKTQTL